MSNFMVRNRSRQSLNAAKKGPRLSRMSSSSGFVGSATSLQGPSKTALRRKSSNLEGDGKQLTLTDLFLSDSKGEEDNKKKGNAPFIPLPPGLLGMIGKSGAGGGELSPREVAAKHAIQIDLRLQNYWKTFATFPESWPELQKKSGAAASFCRPAQ